MIEQCDIPRTLWHSFYTACSLWVYDGFYLSCVDRHGLQNCSRLVQEGPELSFLIFVNR